MRLAHIDFTGATAETAENFMKTLPEGHFSSILWEDEEGDVCHAHMARIEGGEGVSLTAVDCDSELSWTAFAEFLAEQVVSPALVVLPDAVVETVEETEDTVEA